MRRLCAEIKNNHGPAGEIPAGPFFFFLLAISARLIGTNIARDVRGLFARLLSV
jgi:hypothetical protein